MICNFCADWKQNIPKINAPFQLLFARNPYGDNMYTGKIFVFCPWCGNKLEEEELDCKKL